MIFDDVHEDFVNNRSKASIALGHQTFINERIEPRSNIDDVRHEINAQNRHQHIVSILCQNHIHLSYQEIERRLNAQMKDSE